MDGAQKNSDADDIPETVVEAGEIKKEETSNPHQRINEIAEVKLPTNRHQQREMGSDTVSRESW